MKKSIGAKTIIFPTPVFVIATYDKKGRPNVATCAWAGICCSKPPCVSVAFRIATSTYKNIEKRKAFTVNIPSEKFIKEADYFGLVSGRNEDKFSHTRLTPIKSNIVDAPYVREFPFILECALVNTVSIGLHTQFIGEIKDIKVEESVLSKDGLPAIEKIKPMIYEPASHSYYAIGKYLAKAFSIGKERIEKT